MDAVREDVREVDVTENDAMEDEVKETNPLWRPLTRFCRKTR